MVIGRFLAKQFNLAGKDNFEQAKIDAIDGTPKFIPVRFETDEAKRKQIFVDYFTNVAPKLLKDLEVLGEMYGEGEPFFLGNKLTWADLLVHDIFETLLELNSKILVGHSWLLENRVQIDNHPRLVEHFKTRNKSFNILPKL